MHAAVPKFGIRLGMAADGVGVSTGNGRSGSLPTSGRYVRKVDMYGKSGGGVGQTK
ncbi:unnamed protein product [Chondrus crispus]|uniref:Uncharacterized protein n=1 Tax=Chondrus crispus TaxID=2769 RepID=R7QF34_CHOCR|nr:unnamed protein product [Chondrus crispus]CDF36046.1 unnamed protein product [Chondrus crispus]|eukprot:XP_005715865.1 unnamed protein product [Chondrus crispus]